HYATSRARLRDALAAVRGTGLSAEDSRALEVIRRTFEKDLGEEKEPPAAAEPDAAKRPAAPADTPAPEEPACAYDAKALADGPDGMTTLSERMYACFGKAARHL